MVVRTGEGTDRRWEGGRAGRVKDKGEEESDEEWTSKAFLLPPGLGGFNSGLSALCCSAHPISVCLARANAPEPTLAMQPAYSNAHYRTLGKLS